MIIIFIRKSRDGRCGLFSSVLDGGEGFCERHADVVTPPRVDAGLSDTAATTPTPRDHLIEGNAPVVR